MTAMHPFTAATIAARQSALHVLADGGPVVIDVEKRIGTHLSDKQYADLNAALETLRCEFRDIHAADTAEAMRVLTDHAYEAQEAIEVDAK
ncbi:hypothetical protein [Agrococcus sp. DT81.2]|uniref:hypothetical protein n=1 Tax=Agrococcus sp. DT81.2 TaxID=3393414 RepID=UPI003CE4C12A